MSKLKAILSIAAFVSLMQLFAMLGFSQSISNLREKEIEITADTLKIDTLSIVPQSIKLLIENVLVNNECYFVDYAASQLLFYQSGSCNLALGSYVKIQYRVLPVNLTKRFSNKTLKDTSSGFEEDYKPFFYKPKNENTDLFSLSGLSKSGSISRGISFGNNQDVVVNSSLNLQLNGKLSDDINVRAAITDNNIPFQAEGNTQKLQEFDKVYIQIYNDNHKLTAGDFELRPYDSHFLRFFKKGQGGLYQGNISVKENQFAVSASGAVSKGRFVRNSFSGEEQNQGPYQLHGAENEQFIIILSGTEKVYIDGRLLKRGQENDYIIDYNTSEIIFTPNNIITKDLRIVVEFEYSDKNYSRSFLFTNTKYSTSKIKFNLNVFSEQDSKNQPLDQDIDQDLQNVIGGVGDNLEQAVIINADSIAYNNDEILYAKIDTPSSPIPIFIYSTNSDSAHFRVGFSFVGQGNGNYISINNNSNGRVYQWVEPISNQPQGSYEPLRQLISPKKQQWITASSEYKISQSTKISVEGALSNNDINLYSNIDKGNDKGYALKTNIISESFLGRKDSSSWLMRSTIYYELVNKEFHFIEPFRSVEFSRDWSITSSKINTDENLIGAQISFSKNDLLNMGYGFKSFLAGSSYEGYMNDLFFNYTSKKYSARVDASYLSNSSALSESTFLRGAIDLSRNIGEYKFGVGLDGENNPLHIPGTDTLFATSSAKENYKVYVTKKSEEKINYGAEYVYGRNYLPTVTLLKNSDDNSNFTFYLNNSSKSKNTYGAKLTYRQLNVKDTSLNNLSEENSVLGKVDYGFRAWNGFIRSNTYIEFGSGQELKREFSYIKVPAGTGVYSWIDYNNNGVKELSEFETALFPDQAEYIRVFTPTNEFTKTRTNQLNQILNINPRAIIKNSDAFKLLSKLSSQSAIRYSNKIVDEDLLNSLNPFVDINDSSLVSTSASVRNSLFFNKNSSVYSTDITYQILNNKAFLTSGFDFRKQNIYTGNVRWNFTKLFTLNLELENKEIINRADFSGNRNFNIVSNKLKPQISYQSGAKFRLSISYSYSDKTGTTEEADDTKANIHDAGTEIRFSSIKQGILSFQFNYIQNDFTGEVNSPTGYEVLQGLNEGTNYLWNAGMQRNISKSLQLSINYDGRKSPDVNVVHTGSMQVRAFF